ARDARALNDVGTGLLIGAVVGALVGAVLAFAVVAMIETVRAGAWAALGGAALGGSLGALWGTFGRLGASPAWERSYAQLGGSAMVVGVHTVDTKTYERALAVLERYGVWVFDRAGRVIRRP
ncbi:MAG TPA: hypothetical protein VGQ20_01660, partial [Acidimicrobiales bacterium]|nr:hypothetical protein [Acidimicrobiales bacterium]